MNPKPAQPPVPPAPAFVALIGVDWADQKHDYCLQKPGSPTPLTGQFAQTPEAIAAWIQELRTLCGPGKIALAIEASRGPLIYALLPYDHLVIHPINPKSLAKYRETFHPSHAKDDASDAALILDLLAKHRDQLHPWQPDDATTRQLALLVEHRRQLVEQKTGLTNQLGAALKAYFPQALTLLDEQLGSRMAADFLRRWPTLAAAQKAKPATRQRFFYGHNSRSDKLLAEREQLLKTAQPLTTDPAIVNAYGLLVQALATSLAALVAAVAEYDRQIARLFAVHALAPVFTGLPGAGRALAPRLLAAFGTQPDRFATADALACYAGTAPVTVRSGQSCQVHWRWARPKFLHQSFVEFAKASVRSCAWAHCYFDHHVALGHSPWSIYRRLAIRWQRILWKCTQTKSPYREALYLAALKKKRSEVYAKLDHYLTLHPCAQT